MELQKTDIIHPASAIEDIALTATLPSEMVESQQQLISWCDKKVLVCQEEVRETWDAYARAKKMKWKDKPLHNLFHSATKRLVYYEKVRAALMAGFYIVPNFPIDMFAIRTKSKKPTYAVSAQSWHQFEQSAKELPIGEGEYQNPFPEIYQNKFTKTDGGIGVQYYPEKWDEFEFPITMAKANIMEATSRAMSLKIFDRIGIMPATRKEDPVIIGQVFTKKGNATKIVSFMLAWHLDTRMI